MKERVVVFIFRRDLRCEDNMALTALTTQYPDIPVLPIFIFHPLQIDKAKNAYFNQNSVEFMVESLRDLNVAMDHRLHCFEGDDTTILDQLLVKFNIEALAFNKDYTPYAQSRDDKLATWCQKKGIHLITCEDYTLFPLNKLVTGTGKVYEVYTPFYKKCLAESKSIPHPPSKHQKITWYTKPVRGITKTVTDWEAYHGNQTNNQRKLKGGRSKALDILQRIRAKEFKNYDAERDFPAKDKTTKLSAYMKFGCVSVRECFWLAVQAYGLNHSLVRELIWREFCAYVTYHHPYILSHQPLRVKYQDMPWEFNKQWFDAWCQGRTGFPFVDAAMRCLNATGFMHNRLRMVVAMFLTKDMMMHWHHGEKYFAQALVDYDPASNVCGWQWSASVGADAQPYFRIFNPWTQSKRFDSHGDFIYQWIPELRDVPKESLHQWDKHYAKFPDVKYPPPMLDHSEQSKQIKALFQKYV